jgi:hypothetical protein
MNVSEKDKDRAILELLFKLTAETMALREVVMMAISGLSKDHEEVYRKMDSGYKERSEAIHAQLKDLLYKHFGHLDINDVLNSSEF